MSGRARLGKVGLAINECCRNALAAVQPCFLVHMLVGFPTHIAVPQFYCGLCAPPGAQANVLSATYLGPPRSPLAFRRCLN